MHPVITLGRTPIAEHTGFKGGQKREVLTRLLLRLHSNEADTVVIPFLGSGTEVLCAGLLGRSFIAFETDKDSYNTAITRLLTKVGGRNEENKTIDRWYSFCDDRMSIFKNLETPKEALREAIAPLISLEIAKQLSARLTL